jgi:hypothetical protein
MATILDYLENKATVIKTQGPNIFIECPGCGTRQMKCSIHANKGIGNCFRASCPLNGGFRFAKLITFLEKVSWSDALGIASRYEDELELEYKAKAYGLNRNYPKNSLPIQEMINFVNSTDNKLHESLINHGVTYLVNKRKLTEEIIEGYKLGIGYEDFEIEGKIIPRFGMIVIPIFFNDQVVSYVERSIEVKGMMLAKIKHYKPTPAEEYLTSSQILFNCDRAIPLARKEGILCIVEDPWSAMALGNAVGTLDSGLSDDQLFILANNYEGPICSVRDNDRGGREATIKDVIKLSRYFEDVRTVEVKGIDPDDFLEDTKQKIKKSKPVDLFEMRLKGLLST